MVTFSVGRWNLNIFSSTNLDWKDCEFASSWTCNDKKQVHGLVIVLLRKKVIYEEVRKCGENHITDWSTIKSTLKDTLRDYIFEKKKRNPMILPIITEV